VAAVTIAEGFQELHLTFSRKKSIIVSSAKDFAKRIAAMLKEHGYHLIVADEVRDLGIDTTCGKTRSTRVLKSRITKGTKRAKRVRVLASFTKNPAKLFSTNLWPVSKYGATVTGLSPSMQKQIRTFATAAAGGRQGHCATTTLALQLAKDKDPAILYPISVVSDWLAFWDSQPQLHQELRRSWHFIRARLRGTQVPWRDVRGPIGTCIQVLSDLKWVPWHPDQWREPEPSPLAWGYVSGASPFPLFQAITDTVHSQLCATASRHFLGKGYEHGVDMTVAKKLTRKAEKLGDQATVGLIRTVATASFWPRQRKFDCGLVHSPLCTRCGRQPETSKHRYWECEANDLIGHDAITNSEYLRNEALRLADTCPVYWLRGLQPIPAAELAAPPPEDDDLRFVGGGIWSSGTYYVDGSGGTFASDPRLRRCGIGIVKLRYFRCTTTRLTMGCSDRCLASARPRTALSSTRSSP